MMPLPDPLPDTVRRREWRRFRCLFSVTVGGTITVLIPTAAAILWTATVGSSVIAPLFETVIAIVPIALR